MLRFDIILPTIGRESLRRAIDSVIKQSYQDWLLWIIADQIVIPNCWPMELDDRIIVYETIDLPASPDSGARARNFGIHQGDADWIAYIDDDDEWLPNHLETHARMIEENPGVSMSRTAGQSFMMKHKSPRSSKKARKLGPINTIDILTVGMAHTRTLFSKTDGWQACDNHDHLLWKQLLAAGGQYVSSDEVTFLFER